jgi:hypothetical protein
MGNPKGGTIENMPELMQQLRPGLLQRIEAYKEKTMSISKVNLAWVAGLFEGEGSFDVKISKRKTYHNEYLRMQLSSTDEDVIEKLYSYVGVGTVHGPYANCRNDGLERKSYWHWTVSGSKALILAQKLLPFLGKRRTEKLEELLETHPTWKQLKFSNR